MAKAISGSSVRYVHLRRKSLISDFWTFVRPKHCYLNRALDIKENGTYERDGSLHSPGNGCRTPRTLKTRFRTSCYHYRSFWSSSNDEKEGKKGRVFVVEHSPLKFLDLKVKLFLMRSYFDKDFNEEEFLIGAKQALCVVSGHLAKHEFGELHGLVSAETIQVMRQDINETKLKEPIEVKESDIQHLSVIDVQFEYNGGGRKWASVLVRYFCWATSALTKKMGDVEILHVPFPRIFRYTFQREFTPGVESSWIITEAIHDLNAA